MTEFTLVCRQTPLADVIKLSGDADLYVAPELAKCLDEVVSRAPRAAVVDLTNVTFLDSTCLGLLLRFRRDAEHTGTPLFLVCDNHAILRTLTVTGLDTRFRIVRSLADALRTAVDAA
jgi:anti-anti-sigma factor